MFLMKYDELKKMMMFLEASSALAVRAETWLTVYRPRYIGEFCETYVNIQYTLNHLLIFGSVEVEEQIFEFYFHLISSFVSHTLLCVRTRYIDLR